nr:MAG TPA: hypothetical protein [Caudoviricetes sp.]DAP29505.1 MAG TPA: hypothetical protein [Caudoviricetes sp.]DAY91142.1 MAG TPA: hypothetical protein [Caudoviricetes sp.]
MRTLQEIKKSAHDSPARQGALWKLVNYII